MRKPDDAREYLAQMLPAREMAAASRAIRRNHAYLQQYIKTGKPLWLPETAREMLVQAYPNLDPEKLRPETPVVSDKTTLQRGNESQIDPPEEAKVTDDPRTLQLLEIWSRITVTSQRDFALRMLRQLTDEAVAVSA